MGLAIVLLTYNRIDYAKTTLISTLANLKTSEELYVHIASDGDDEGYLSYLRQLAVRYVGEDHTTVSSVARLGYGASYNAATQVVHSLAGVEFVLPLEDDWELRRTLDIEPCLQVLRDRVFGCIRMGYVGYTQQLRASFVSHVGHHWLALDPDSPEPHVFAGHPRLETVAWERSVGEWPEGLQPGQTEWEVAHRRAAREQVAWPISIIKPEGDAFVHIGAERSW